MAKAKPSRTTKVNTATSPEVNTKALLKAAKDFSAKDIDVHLGLDMVRADAQVFINNLDSYGLFILVKEPIDNAKDEHVLGFGNKVVVLRDKDTFFVCDEGRGIPIDIHPKTKKSVLETVLTTLAAGSKMRKGAKATAGTHGMGVSITNALSLRMQAWVYRNKSWHTQVYEKGKPTGKVTKCAAPKLPFKYRHPNQGTIISFKPDLSIFNKGATIEDKQLHQFLQMSAYINPKCSFTFTTKDGTTKYHEPKGFEAYVSSLIEQHEVEKNHKPMIINGEAVHAYLQWTTHTDEVFEAFANGTRTVEGGKHVDGFYRALNEALKPFRKKNHSFTAVDLRMTGVVGVLNALVSKPVFANQTKDKLISTEAADLVYNEVFPQLKSFFTKNKSLANHIIKRAIANRDWAEKTKANKKDAAAMQVEKKGKLLLPPKLALHSNTKLKPDDVELFLVEGDSAGGTTKQARDKTFQEVLPLRGKPQNVYKTKNPLANREIRDILIAIGYDSSNPTDPLKKRRVGRVILLTDPDPDGGHIDNLVLAHFQKNCPEILELGMVFTIEKNLYVYSLANDKIFGKDAADIQKKLGKKKMDAKNLTRIKGWGEIGPEILRPVACDTKTRHLLHIKPMDMKSKEDLSKFKGVVGEDTGFRKELLGITA